MNRDETLVSIVDDDESLRRSVRNLLTSMGFRVETFPSAEAFLGSANRSDTACLVLDLRMPRLDGFELARKLRADPSTCRLPMVAVTGDPMADDSIAARAPFTRVLRKPISGGLLLDTVSGVIHPTH